MRIINRKKFFRFLFLMAFLLALIPLTRETRTIWNYQQSADQAILRQAMDALGQEDGLFKIEAREWRGQSSQMLLTMIGAVQEGQVALKGELPIIKAPFALVYSQQQWHRQDPLNGTWWKLTPGEMEGQKAFIDPLLPWMWLPESLDQGAYQETLWEDGRRLRVYQGVAEGEFSWMGSQWRLLSSEVVLQRQTGNLVRLSFWAADVEKEDKTLEWSIQCYPMEKKTWQEMGF